MSRIRLQGSTSGYAELAASAIAGDVTITLPSTTGTVATTNGGQTIQFAAGSAGAPALTTTGDTNTGIFFPTADTVAFAEGGVESMRVDSSGRLLVGTSTARTNVQRSSGNSLTPTIQGETAAGNFPAYSFLNNSSGGYDPIIALGLSKGSTIGSNTAVANGDGIGQLIFMGNDGTNFVNSAAIIAQVDGTPGTNDMPGRLIFATTLDGSSFPTERMRITNDGKLLVGTTSSSSPAGLGSTHNIKASTNSAWTTVIEHSGSTPNGLAISYTGASPNNNGREFLYCSDSSTARAYIRSDGGFANYSSNNANLSDRNAKKDISPAADTWDCIKEWEIVNYRYKDQPNDADLNLGVIAQQVAESCPEVITVFSEAKDDQPEKLGVKEQQMYWMAIKALQEAQLRIETLEASNADLAARLTALEAN